MKTKSNTSVPFPMVIFPPDWLRITARAETLVVSISTPRRVPYFILINNKPNAFLIFCNMIVDQVLFNYFKAGPRGEIIVSFRIVASARFAQDVIDVLGEITKIIYKFDFRTRRKRIPFFIRI